MSEVVPAAETAESPGSSGSSGPLRRGPRKRFLVIGIVVAAALGIGLFTSIGTSQPSGGAPRSGDALPSFTRTNIGPDGSAQVSLPADGGSNGLPAVLLFFGAWCPSCGQELPPLTAAIRSQQRSGGALSHIRVIGIDSEDTVSTAKRFIRAKGVTFPVAYDPDLTVTSGIFYFVSDPDAVFVRGNGTIDRVVIGGTLTPASFVADERALIPSGR